MSSISAVLLSLGSVVIGGTMTMVTAWWQSLNARKTRLAELEVQLRNERYLRDEALRRTAMLELAYMFRRFSSAASEADLHHEHNQELSSQLDSPAIAKLAELGQTSIDLLDKDVSLIDRDTREALEHVRDMWEDVSRNQHVSAHHNNALEECCPLGRDFNIMEAEISNGVNVLERNLDAMRFT